MNTGKPKVKQEHIRKVTFTLRLGQWMKGKDIAAHAGVPFRLIRAVAENTAMVISGQRGYKLVSAATPEEIEASAADLESRAAHLLNRAARTRAHLQHTGDLFS